MNTNDQQAAPQPPPEGIILQIALSALMSQALYVAAKLGVADLLAQGPRPVSELAAETKTHAGALYRVLRSLASAGVFTETDPRVFALTPIGEALRKDAPNSMRNAAIFMGEEWHWRVWGDMLHSVETGRPAWGHVHGAEVFDYFGANRREAAIFNAAMTDLSSGVARPIVAAYDFSAVGTLADIAGGHGFLLAQALKANPDMRGVLFEVPSVVAGAPELLAREGVAERVEFVTGNFFEAVPVKADAYMMKHIIHDWDDERATLILSNIRASMPDAGRVLIIEQVVPAGDAPHPAKLLDLEMLVSPGGIERTAEEYRALCAAAGLQLTRIVPTPTPFSIVEAVKA
jgi:hypothetical protein